MFLGEWLAVAASAGFAFGSFYFRFGQRERPGDDGVFTANFVNLCVNLPVLMVVILIGKLPPLNLTGIGLFVLGGVLTSFLGRIFWMRSIRLIGPSRATSLEGTYPLFAAALAVIFLGEHLGIEGWIGAVLAIGGILLLGNETPKRQPATAAVEPELVAVGTGAYAEQAAPAPGPRERDERRDYLAGFAAGVGSSVAFGIGAVVRKFGLLALPSPFIAAPISSLTATVGMIAVDLGQGRGFKRLRAGLLAPPSGFVIGGVLTGAAQLVNLIALYLAPVSKVSVINASQPVITVIAGALIFRQHDNVNWRVATASAAIVAGIVLVALR